MIKGYQAEIERIYENIREREDNAFRERRKEIQEKLPMVLDIEAQIGKLCVEVAVSSFKDIPDREAHINKKFLLNMVIQEIILKNTMPAINVKIQAL
jgi:DNA replication protein DnaC